VPQSVTASQRTNWRSSFTTPTPLQSLVEDYHTTEELHYSSVEQQKQNQFYPATTTTTTNTNSNNNSNTQKTCSIPSSNSVVTATSLLSLSHPHSSATNKRSSQPMVHYTKSNQSLKISGQTIKYPKKAINQHQNENERLLHNVTRMLRRHNTQLQRRIIYAHRHHTTKKSSVAQLRQAAATSLATYRAKRQFQQVQLDTIK
jgi:hypothetical protein